MNCTGLIYNSSVDLISFCYKGCDYKVNECFCYCLDDKILYNINYTNYTNIIMTCLFVTFIIFGSVSVMTSCAQKRKTLIQNSLLETQETPNSTIVNIYEVHDNIQKELPKYEDLKDIPLDK